MKVKKIIRNPYDVTREMVTKTILNSRKEHSHEKLNEKIQEKFRKKSFQERFIGVFYTADALRYIIQIVSMITGFIAFSYILKDWNPLFLAVVAPVLLVAIEITKRACMEDIMERAVQHSEKVSKFAVCIGLAAIGASIFISLQGAMLAPNLAIADATPPTVVETSDQAIQSEYNNRIAKLEQERETYRGQRVWRGRVSSKDAQYIKQIQGKIQETLEKKDAALMELKASNEALRKKAEEAFQEAKATVSQDRQTLAQQLYWIQLVAELLYIICSAAVWSYCWEVYKEQGKFPQTISNLIKAPLMGRQTYPKGTAGVPEAHGGSTPRVRQTYYEGTADVPQEDGRSTPKGTADVPKKERVPIGFRQQESGTKEEITYKEKEYTKRCKNCGKGYIHNAANQLYCSTSCKKAAYAKRKKSNVHYKKTGQQTLF